jgi:MFS family permease
VSLVPRRFWLIIFWAWAALGIFELLLPLYGRALGVSSTTVGWLFGVFSFTGLVLRLVLGRLLDHIPRRPVLLLGLALYVVVFVLFAVADSVGMLLLARLLQGIASSAVWLTATVLVADWAPTGHQARVFGRYQVVSVWGSALGAVWGGVALALLDGDTRVTMASLLESIGTSNLLDRLPSPWPTLAVLHLVFAGNAVFAMIALVLALRLVEPVRAQALPPLPGPARPPAALSMVALLSGVAAGLLLPVVVLLIDDRFGLGGAGVGIVYAVPGIVYAVAPEPLGRLADRWGHRVAAVGGLLCVALSYGLFPFAPTLVLTVGLLCIEAVGASLSAPALLALVRGGTAQRTGSAYGWYTTASLLGVALGSPLGGWLYERALPAPFVTAAACTALAALVLQWGAVRRVHAPVDAVHADN